ncbi:palmitoyl hydrolase [Fusarium circinatum]|uniref:Palmitoyl hydrolase n=1 Tax=Fusarium circinatum TaxID=48490 RepID=A0A8H5X5C7_FUSCI|nr:palmitoyl hydrolase [Fusarium circinatum]
MCQDRHLLFAPCGHTLHEEKWFCKRAKSFIGLARKLLLRKKCEPVNVIAIVIDWCRYCKVIFERIVQTIGVHPVTFNCFWDPRLMDRYWSIKSQNERVRPVDPEVIGPVAFQCYDEIEYNKIRAGPDTVKRKVDSWELRCLQAEVRKLKPVCVWIKDYEHEPAETVEDQMDLCNVSLVETQTKAYHHGLVP